MKVILYMAQTINGMIAKLDYTEDFLSHENWITFTKLVKNKGCFIIGRKTYDVVSKWDGETFDDVKACGIIVSKNKNLRLRSYTIANSPKDALKKAQALGFTKVILTGGSHINSSFMRQGLIDEIIINIEPYVLGSGIRLFKEDNFENRLKLIDIKKINSGIVQLHYKVVN